MVSAVTHHKASMAFPARWGLLLVLLGLAGPPVIGGATPPDVVVFAVDGLASTAANAHWFEALANRSVHTLDARTQWPADSWSGWARVLYAAPAAFTGVVSRYWKEGAHPITDCERAAGGDAVATEACGECGPCSGALPTALDTLRTAHGHDVQIIASLASSVDWQSYGTGATPVVHLPGDHATLDYVERLLVPVTVEASPGTMATQQPPARSKSRVLLAHLETVHRMGHLHEWGHRRQYLSWNRLMRRIRKLEAAAPRTLFALVSDHGGHADAHGKTPHIDDLRVPFFVWTPTPSAWPRFYNVKGALRTSVENADLFPTVYGLLGYPRPSAFRGRSVLYSEIQDSHTTGQSDRPACVYSVSGLQDAYDALEKTAYTRIYSLMLGLIAVSLFLCAVLSYGVMVAYRAWPPVSIFLFRGEGGDDAVKRAYAHLDDDNGSEHAPVGVTPPADPNNRMGLDLEFELESLPPTSAPVSEADLSALTDAEEYLANKEFSQ
jgi:hypothetical protein